MIPAAKTAIILTMIILASAVLAIGSIISVMFFDSVKTGLEIQQPIPFISIAIITGKVMVASLLLIAIQSAVSYRFSTISVSLGVGISGTFLAMFATSWKYGHYFPWLMPIRAIHGPAEQAMICLLLSSTIGVTLIAATIIYGAKRDPGLLR